MKKKVLRRKRSKVARGNFLVIFFVSLLFVSFVIATAPSWGGSSTVNYSTDEGNFYFHNLSLNVSGYSGDVSFAINTIGTNITWTNASGLFQVTDSDVSSFLKIYNSAWGNLTINSTWENQTGVFTVPIQATNTTDDEATTTVFEFLINATNDIPEFDSTETVYNWTSGVYAAYDINVTDEEFHYPINYTLTPVNCTHAEYVTDRYQNQNCTIFGFTETGNTTAIADITPVTDDVGEYWFNLTIDDFNSACPHSACEASEYEVNKTNSKLVLFNVFATLSINASDCEGAVLTEDTEFTCEINITTPESSDSINVSSLAYYQNSDFWTISNSSFFFSGEYVNSTNFTRSVNVTFTPEKRNVGNYTINFSVNPDSPGDTVVSQISIYVNFTEEPVSLGSVSNVTIYENRTLYVSATDEDLLIQDYSVRDENLTFAVNESFVTLTPQSLGSFDNFINLTLNIDYDNLSASGDGNYSVLLNVTDVNGSVDSLVFIIEVLDDVPAEWNSSKSYINVSNEGDEIYINLSEYVNDTETLTFSFSSSNSFSSFNLTTDGIINFTSNNSDVGYHNVTMNAYDGKLNSYKSWNFTVYNVDDAPGVVSVSGTGGLGSIEEGEYISVVEDSEVNFTTFLNDSDFYIPNSQRSEFYDENLTVSVNTTNSTGDEVSLFNFNLVSVGPGAEKVQYMASFTPSSSQIENYSIVLNISDVSGLFVLRTFELNISGVNDAPAIEAFSNQNLTINDTLYVNVNATDQEDGNDSAGVINFSISNLTIGGDFLTINVTSGEINFNLNETYEGVWSYNVTVNDTAGSEDFQIFTLRVFGYPDISNPSSGYIFNWTEGTPIGNLKFNASYAVNSSLLTYKFYMDNVYYYNSTHYNYSILINSSSIRNETNFTLNTNNNFTLNMTLNYTDESYLLHKNLTLIVYNYLYPELNRSMNWKVNISYKNQNVTFKDGAYITDKGPATYGSAIEVNLSELFEDADYFDNNRSQTVNFSLTTVSGSGFVKAASSFSGWILSLDSPAEITEVVNITAYEYADDEATLIGTAQSNSFQVEFIAPTTTTTPISSGGGGSTTKLKFFSIKLVVPEEVIISDKNFIEIPFSIQNNGQTDLRGIDLSSYIQFNSEFSDDVSISLPETFIEELKFGESEEFTMRINANTQKSGRYKATIFANVTTPKFSDFGDFFIELRKTNESEAEQILIFTQEFLSENPECIELTELLNEARELFSIQDFVGSANKAREVTDACEDAITSNEQISFSASELIENNFYYAASIILTVFLAGFIFYIYKRVRFNKYKVKDYI